jgi:high mobility group protein B1
MYAMSLNQQYYMMPHVLLPDNNTNSNNNTNTNNAVIEKMSSKKDSKPKGRMSNYTFFVQMCREEHRKKHPNENVNFTEFSKKCAERWKQMTDNEKKRFAEMAEKDKQRYDHEMASYTPPIGEGGGGGRKRQKKDPNAPKRPLSAFFLFCHDERPAVKAIYPNYSVGEAAKELGERWNKVSPELKTKYEERVALDKIRYNNDMSSYKSKA